MLVTDICLSVSCQKMFLQLISANRQNTLFNYAFHKSSLFSIFFYVFSKKLLTTSVFSCIVHYVVEMQQNFIIKVVQEWRNWQTRRLQVPVVARSCGFKSHLLHCFFRFAYQELVRWTNSDCPDGKCENFPSGYFYFSRKENNSDRTFYAQYTLQKYSRKEISVIRQK